jgi:hypothetical protein
VHTNPTASQSQKINKLLGRQRRRIRRRFLIHGLGWVLGVTTALAVAYYLTDRSLRLPGGVRILLSTAALAYVLYVFRRHLLYPLGRHITSTDVAVVLERRFPELHQKLVSAFELQDLVEEPDREKLRNQSPDMIRLVVAEAAAESRSLPVNRILNPRRTFRVWGLAACFFLIAFTGAVANPEACGVFLQRVLGLSVLYPRSTMLHIELPPESPELRKQVFPDQRVVQVTIATGADLTVAVNAEGKIPPEVLLNSSGGRGGSRKVAMTSRGGGRFRYVFHRVKQSFEFYASGGDDDVGDMTVRVATITPPEVADIRAAIQEPAYTGNPQSVQSGGMIEALEGSHVELSVTATTDVETATLTFMDSGRRIELEPQVIEDDSGTSTAFTGEFRVTVSERYQIELLGTTGLRNPRPGYYNVNALRDYGPVGNILNPVDDPLAVALPRGVIALRVSARDDYGLTAARLTVELSRSAGEAGRVLELIAPGAPPSTETVLTRLVEIGELRDGEPVSIGQTIGLSVELVDNREPEHHTSTLSPRQIPVVEEADLVRRIAGHFRRVRADVEGAQLRQEDGLDHMMGLLEELESGLVGDRVPAVLTAVEVAQVRIHSVSRNVHEEFMRSFNVHLFNRQEPSNYAEDVLELYLTWHQSHPDPRPFVPDFYRMIGVERQESRLGAMEAKLDPILSMTLRSDGLYHELAPAAIDLVKNARIAGSPEATMNAVREAITVQEQIFAALGELLEKLEEWNEFQDVIDETRALRNKQRDVQVRTQSIRGVDKKDPDKDGPDKKNGD